MRKLLLFLFLFPCWLQAQDADTTWKKGGNVMMNFSQVSLTNWAAGGKSSISVTGLFSGFLNFKNEKTAWENHLSLAYGMLKPEKDPLIKSDDKIDFTTKYGRKAFGDHWYYTVLGNFKSQFTKGFQLPNDSIIISDFLSPGYLVGAAGLDFKPSKSFSVVIAPVSFLFTFVNNSYLSSIGAFGVEKGENYRSEFGGFVKAVLDKEVFKNITWRSQLDLFSNYTKNAGNIDVNWDNLLLMKVNKIVTCSVGAQMIYDHDVSVPVDRDDDGIFESAGPRLQFKETLNIGLQVKF